MFTLCNSKFMGISEIDFAYLRRLVRENSGVTLYTHKVYLAELHLKQLATSSGFDSIPLLVAHLRSKNFSSLHKTVIEVLVNYETTFFRDFHPFETLKKFVFPALIEKRKKERKLNIWCAACSSGQEPYSIAMLMREDFPMLANWKLTLIASDFSSKILEVARKGHYSQLEIQRGLPKSLRDKYFLQKNQKWQIQEEIAQMVEFKQINLIEPLQVLPQMDIIFLRNVMIYFDVETKKSILRQMRNILKPDGYLFLGGSETTLNLDEAFIQVRFDKSICHTLNINTVSEPL